MLMELLIISTELIEVKMKHETILELVESYICGNIGYVKSKVKLMTKVEFLDFIEECRANGMNPHTLKNLV